MTEPVSELARLRGLVDGLDAVIWEADASTGAFTFVSEGVRNVLGFAADRQIGIRVRLFTPFFDRHGRIELKTTGAYGIVRHPIYAANRNAVP